MSKYRLEDMNTKEKELVILHLISRLDEELGEKHRLQVKLDSTTELIDFYVKHYEKLGKRGLAGRFKMLQEDVERTIE